MIFYFLFCNFNLLKNNLSLLNMFSATFVFACLVTFVRYDLITRTGRKVNKIKFHMMFKCFWRTTGRRPLLL